MVDVLSEREFLKVEYERVKAEQIQRIGFRDNLLFVHLAAIGAVASWVLANLQGSQSTYALLVVPYVCLVLGWTYVINDHLISRTGEYIREIMERRVSRIAPIAWSVKVTEGDNREFLISETFGWEPFHRTDKRRTSRKALQFVIDVFTFVLPGALAMIVFFILRKEWNIFRFIEALRDARPESWVLLVVYVSETISLVFLSYTFFVYADFVRGRSKSSNYELVQKADE